MDRKRLMPILAIIFTNILGAGAILPILPLYAEGQFGGTIVQVTLLSTAYFAAQFIAAPILGRLSDRYGRRPILIISQIGTVVAFILFIFAGELGNYVETLAIPLNLTGGMFMMYAARILDGITGGNITTAQAYVSDITPPERRAEGLGLLQGAFGAGFIFGPAFGGILANMGGARAPFIGAVIITTGTLLLTTFTLEESLPAEKRTEESGGGPTERIDFRSLLKQPAFFTVLAVALFATLAHSALPATFSLYADKVLFVAVTDASRVQLYIGLMLTFNGIMQVITQVGLLRPLIRRLGERRLLFVGQFALMVSMFLIAPVRNAVLATSLFAPYAFGQGVSQPSMQSLMTKFGKDRTSGQLLGIFQSVRSLALIAGPVWAGYAFENISPQAVFTVGGFLALTGLVFAFVLNLQEMPRAEADADAVEAVDGQPLASPSSSD